MNCLSSARRLTLVRSLCPSNFSIFQSDGSIPEMTSDLVSPKSATVSFPAMSP